MKYYSLVMNWIHDQVICFIFDYLLSLYSSLSILLRRKGRQIQCDRQLGSFAIILYLCLTPLASLANSHRGDYDEEQDDQKQNQHGFTCSSRCVIQALVRFDLRKVVQIAMKLNWLLFTRVPQKNQKSEFCFATNPTGFHRLDEPPEKFQHQVIM